MIFGIGLQKSGTSSLHSALEMLNYRSHHFPIELLTSNYFGGGAPRQFELSTSQLNFDAIAAYDAVCDIPVCIPEVFSQLDARFPGSLFIYTYRSPASWAKSVEKHHDRESVRAVKEYRLDHYPGYDPANDIYKTCDSVGVFEFCYDVPIGSDKRNAVLQAYCVRHRQLVEEYFADRTEQILFLDVAEAGAMTRLADFLGVTAPFPDFPHKNAATWNPKIANAVLAPYRAVVPENVRFGIRRRKNILLEKYFRRERSVTG